MNPLFGDRATPQRTAFSPQINPVWSPQVDTDAVMALPPPPSDFLSVNVQPTGGAGKIFVEKSALSFFLCSDLKPLNPQQ